MQTGHGSIEPPGDSGAEMSVLTFLGGGGWSGLCDLNGQMGRMSA